MTKNSKINSKINSNISKLSFRKSKNIIIISLIIIIIVIVYLIITTFVLDNRKDPFDALNINNTYYSIINPPEDKRRVSSHWDLNINPSPNANPPKTNCSIAKNPPIGSPEKGYYDSNNPPRCWPGYDHISSMLDTLQGWSAFDNSAIDNNSVDKEWLQMDLDSIMTVSGVVTQGRGPGIGRNLYDNSFTNQSVIKYTVKYSSNGKDWNDVDNGNMFDGNTNKVYNSYINQNDKIGSMFNKAISARYIRIYPQKYITHTSMRAAVLVPNSVTMTINNKKTLYPITNGSINVNNTTYQVLNPPDNTSTRQMSNTIPNHVASMLDSPQGWSTFNDNKQWLQLNLDANTAIAGVITQSRGIGFPNGGGDYSNQMVTQYQVQYSNDNINWTYVVDVNNNNQFFVGNSPVDDKIGNLFSKLISTKFIRILPTNYSNHTSMRAGLLVVVGEPILVDGVVSVIKK